MFLKSERKISRLVECLLSKPKLICLVYISLFINIFRNTYIKQPIQVINLNSTGLPTKKG